MIGLVGEHPLKGRRALVTSGPTFEPIDPVRFIGNRSSGKQGHAIAAALAALGADTLLVTGPTKLSDPANVRVTHVETAEQMPTACRGLLPVDVAVCAAAVADWKIAQPLSRKIKNDGSSPPSIALAENPDILATVSHLKTGRPKLVVGFAAETEKVIEHAKTKLSRKGCDWIVANDVSPASGVMGGDRNTVHLVTKAGVESWPSQSKDEVARTLIERVAAALDGSAR